MNDAAKPDPDTQEALVLGRQAGLLSLPAGLNPFPIGSHNYAEWERGRQTIAAKRLAHELRARARTAPCRYIVNAACDCGGRGLCLDVA